MTEIRFEPLDDEDLRMIRQSGNTAVKILFAIVIFLWTVTVVFYLVDLRFVAWIIAGASVLLIFIAALIKVLTGVNGRGEKMIIRGRLDDKFYTHRNNKNYWYTIDHATDRVITEKIYLGSHVTQSWSRSYSTTPGLYFQFGERSIVVNVGVFMDHEIGETLEVHYVESMRRILKARRVTPKTSLS